MEKIDNFSGDFAFLSNFWICQIIFDDEIYSSVEAAFQAAKTFDKNLRLKIRLAKTPADAKRLGRAVPLRSNWENVKLGIMEDFLNQKFKIPELASALLDTDTTELIEGNWWGDQYWGVCRGKGKNHLGKLLMKIRKGLCCVSTHALA